MTYETLQEAQAYLTQERNGESRRLIDLEHLRSKHNTTEILSFLKDYRKEKERALRNMILIDKTHRKVDQLVASIFRIYMAIKTLEDGEVIHVHRVDPVSDGKEVRKIVGTKSRTGQSSKLSKRDSSGHSRAGVGQDEDHDGEDRTPGDETRCIA
jgi:hypothetical protein